jgi:hypothetical protein
MSITNLYAETEADLTLEAVKRLDDFRHGRTGPKVKGLVKLVTP